MSHFGGSRSIWRGTSAACLAMASWLGWGAVAAAEPVADLMDTWFSHRDQHPERLPDKHVGNEVFYQIVVDRFANGDTANDCLAEGKHCDPSHRDWFRYWGGDLQGVVDHVDYLKGLGVNRLWLTPIFENNLVKVGRGDRQITSYHGYWIRDWFRLNPMFTGSGSQDFSQLDSLINQAGPDLKVVLDTVVNHTSPSDASSESLEWLDNHEPIGPVQDKPRSHVGALFRDGQFVTSLLDDEKSNRQPKWFHHFGNIQDYNNQYQVENFQLDGLADLNQDSPEVAAYMRDAHNFWLDRFPGLAGYRMDTIKHVSFNYWQGFDRDFAAAHPDREIVGEFFGGGPRNSASHRFYRETHMTMFDFDTHYALVDAFLNRRSLRVFPELWATDPNLIDARSLVTFLDNHDLPRMRGMGATFGAMRQAIAMLFLSRGVPCVYYGMEQDLFTPNDPGDPYNRPMMAKFDQNAEFYQLIASLASLRRSHPSLRYGSTHVLAAGDRVLAFERADGSDRVLVAVSTNDGGRDDLNLVNVTLPNGSYQDLLTRRRYDVRDGRLQLALGGGDIIVLSTAANDRVGDN